MEKHESIYLEDYSRARLKKVLNVMLDSQYTLFMSRHVLQDFMIQGGDPTGTGRGGESIYGKTFEVLD